MFTFEEPKETKLNIMKSENTVLEKVIDLHEEFYDANKGNGNAKQCAILSLNNERKTIERLMIKLKTAGAQFTLASELDRIDQLIEKSKTL